LKNIGVILPCSETSENFIVKFFKKFRCEIFPVEEYGFNFIVVYDNQNCGKLFKKHNVQSIVILTDAEMEYCDFEILQGNSVYRRMLPDFVRKMTKSFGTQCSVTLVDKHMTDYGMEFAEKLCGMCANVYVSSQNTARAEYLCEQLLEKYGVVVELIDEKSIIKTHMAVVVEGCGNSYDKKCVVIDKSSKKHNEKVVNDFYIPFCTKPPFGMSNLIFAECIEK